MDDHERPNLKYVYSVNARRRYLKATINVEARLSSILRRLNLRIEDVTAYGSDQIGNISGSNNKLLVEEPRTRLYRKIEDGCDCWLEYGTYLLIEDTDYRDKDLPIMVARKGDQPLITFKLPHFAHDVLVFYDLENTTMNVFLSTESSVNADMVYDTSENYVSELSKKDTTVSSDRGSYSNQDPKNLYFKLEQQPNASIDGKRFILAEQNLDGDVSNQKRDTHASETSARQPNDTLIRKVSSKDSTRQFWLIRIDSPETFEDVVHAFAVDFEPSEILQTTNDSKGGKWAFDVKTKQLVPVPTAETLKEQSSVSLKQVHGKTKIDGKGTAENLTDESFVFLKQVTGDTKIDRKGTILAESTTSEPNCPLDGKKVKRFFEKTLDDMDSVTVVPGIGNVLAKKLEEKEPPIKTAIELLNKYKELQCNEEIFRDFLGEVAPRNKRWIDLIIYALNRYLKL